MIPFLTEFLNALAVSFDLPILDWIQANLQSPLMDTIMPIITMFGDDGIFWIACAVILLLIPKTRRTGLGMGIALAMGLVICNIILKPVVGRIRPYDFQEQYNNVIIPMLISGLSDFSFPSGHTTAAFAAMMGLFLATDKRKSWPALIFAVVMGLSRIYLGVHYPSDVIAGAAIGTLGSFAVYKLLHRR